MPINIKELMAQTGIQMASTFVQVLMGALLENIKEHNDPEFYKEVVQTTVHAGRLLEKGAEQTKSKVDDIVVVNFILTPALNAAQADGIDVTGESNT